MYLSFLHHHILLLFFVQATSKSFAFLGVWLSPKATPYPLVGSFTRTWGTAPIIFPSWMIGLPDTSDCHSGQQSQVSFPNKFFLYHRQLDNNRLFFPLPMPILCKFYPFSRVHPRRFVQFLFQRRSLPYYRTDAEAAQIPIPLSGLQPSRAYHFC